MSEEAQNEKMMVCRGVRGATTVTSNDKEEMLAVTRELLYLIIRANQMETEDIASAIFTTTQDLNATYPALAARQMGWYDIALMCGHEMSVPDGLPMCIRVLIHWNTTQTQKEIVHVYLREAKSLRPDHHSLPMIPAEEIEAAIKQFNLSHSNGKESTVSTMTLIEPNS